jgi:hypothetical protein
LNLLSNKKQTGKLYWMFTGSDTSPMMISAKYNHTSSARYLRAAESILTAVVLLYVACGATAAAPNKSAPIAKHATGSGVQTLHPGSPPPGTASAAAYNAYINTLRGRLANKWFLADGNNHVILAATIAADGSVTNLDLTSTPKNPAAEQAASDAFNGCQPLQALPGTCAARLTLTFDSTADPHGDSTSKLGGKIDPLPAASATGASPDTNKSKESNAAQPAGGSDGSTSAGANQSKSN